MKLCLLLLGARNTFLIHAQPSNLNAGEERIADETEESDWLAYGRTHDERRFSPLTQLSDQNVGTWRADWYLDQRRVSCKR